MRNRNAYAHERITTVLELVKDYIEQGVQICVSQTT